MQSNKLQIFFIRVVYNSIYAIGHDFGPCQMRPNCKNSEIKFRHLSYLQFVL